MPELTLTDTELATLSVFLGSVAEHLTCDVRDTVPEVCLMSILGKYERWRIGDITEAIERVLLSR